MFGACHFSQLSGHAESSNRLLRLVGRKRLLFGFSFRANGGLECEAGSMLPRDMLHRVRSWPSLLANRSSALKRKDHLTDFDLLAFFDFQLFHHAADRRWDFDYRF